MNIKTNLLEDYVDCINRLRVNLVDTTKKQETYFKTKN